MLTARELFSLRFRKLQNQAGKIRMLLRVFGSLESSTGYGNLNKIPKHSAVYTSTPPRLPDPPFRFFKGLDPRLLPPSHMERLAAFILATINPPLFHFQGASALLQCAVPPALWRAPCQITMRA